MKNLKKLYLQQVKLPESDTFKDIIPTSVFSATTRCTAVRSAAAAAFNKAVRETFAEKATLVGAFRECLDTGMMPEVSDEYDPAKIKKAADLLLNSKAAGGETRIKPKFVLSEGFFQILTGSVDFVVRENGDLTLVKLSKAKTAAADELSVLIYVLLAFCSMYNETAVVFKKLPIVRDGGKEEIFRLEKSDLTELPEVTLKKILSSLVETKRDKGPDCATCIHAPYCTVLAKQLEQEAIDAADRD